MRSSLCRSYSLGSAIFAAVQLYVHHKSVGQEFKQESTLLTAAMLQCSSCRSLLSQAAATAVSGRKRDSSQQGQQLRVVLIVFDGYRRLPVVICFLTNFKANFETSQQTVAA